MATEDTQVESNPLPDALGDVIETLRGSTDVARVFGDPIEHDGRLVVPVAKIAYGFGGGAGEGPDGEEGRGVGGGGGATASPVGALEIDDDGTRFVRFGGRPRLAGLAGLALGVGLAVGVDLGRNVLGD